MNCFLSKINIQGFKSQVCGFKFEQSVFMFLGLSWNCRQIIQVAIYFLLIHFWNNIKWFDVVKVYWSVTLFTSDKSDLQGPENYITVFAITTVGNFPSRFFSVQVDLFHSMHSKDIKLLPCCWLEETCMGCTFEFSWILLFFLCFFFSFTFFRTFVSLCVFSSSFSSSLFFASLATATDFFIGGGLSNLSELLTIEPQGFIFLCVWLFDVNVCFALSNFF